MTKKTKTPMPEVDQTWVANFNDTKVVITEIAGDKVVYKYLDGPSGAMNVGHFLHYFRKVD